MSVVTGLVLTCSVAEGQGDDQGPTQLPVIRTWLRERKFAPLADVTHHASGMKHPQCYIYAAGYNYFDEDAFARLITNLAWEYPENVVLIMQPEDGATRVWRINGT